MQMRADVINKDHDAQIAELNKQRESFFSQVTKSHQLSVSQLTSDYETQLTILRQQHAIEVTQLVAKTEAIWRQVLWNSFLYKMYFI